MIADVDLDLEDLLAPGHTVRRRQNPLGMNQGTATELVAPTGKRSSGKFLNPHHFRGFTNVV